MARRKPAKPSDPQDIAARIWERCVRSPSGCLLWTGANNVWGYGRMGVEGRTVGVHRLVLQAKLGRPIRDGMFALHSCDIRACCNPDHLSEGTHKQNCREKVERGRHPAGADNYKAKLTNQAVSDLRSEFARGGVTHQRLADRYGVSRSTVTEIVNGKRYGNAGGVSA